MKGSNSDSSGRPEDRVKYIALPVVPTFLRRLWQKTRARLPGQGIVAPALPGEGEFRLRTLALTEAFPGIASKHVSLDVGQLERDDEWLLPLRELFTLAAICQHIRPMRVFEFGTYLGVSTSVIADNTPPTTEIFTLDLDPATRVQHHHGLGVGGFPNFVPGSCFLGRLAEAKIHQLLGDSLTFDPSPFRASMDLVFIDSDHTYNFVKSDSDNAFEMLRPGGVILWDDYRWQPAHPECAGVTRVLDELANTRECFALARTRFAAYRDDLKFEKG